MRAEKAANVVLCRFLSVSGDSFSLRIFSFCASLSVTRLEHGAGFSPYEIFLPVFVAFAAKLATTMSATDGVSFLHGVCA